MKVLESISPLLFAYFFIFGGAHLNVSLFPTIGGLGLVYLLVRAGGKIGGASLGAWIGKAPKSVRKFVGLSLIPQVGVAIALAIMVRKEFGTPEYGEAGQYLSVVVINILLFTTIITEIVGPLLTKWALKRAGEIDALE
jgi:Kef-type K+ transport system membrane component KefB